jgi:hypothetical protein
MIQRNQPPKEEYYFVTHENDVKFYIAASINKVLWEHSHVNSFLDCLWQILYYDCRAVGPSKHKIFTIWLFEEETAKPGLGIFFSCICDV